MPSARRSLRGGERARMEWHGWQGRLTHQRYARVSVRWSELRRLKREMEDDEDVRQDIAAKQRLVLMMNSATWCLQRLLHTMAAASTSWEVITRAEYASVLQGLYFDQPSGEIARVSTGAVAEVMVDVARSHCARENAPPTLDAPEAKRAPAPAPA